MYLKGDDTIAELGRRMEICEYGQEDYLNCEERNRIIQLNQIVFSFPNQRSQLGSEQNWSPRLI